MEIIPSISETTAYCKIIFCLDQAILCQLKHLEFFEKKDWHIAR
ncbi:hypothetical protein T05_13217 [Trichinella murrelli]|uniref:Uncharacterized protein n=1 Tax=Trichinella murrelli TaxID=144512 RepID=A0A0V0SYJ3_9BILA|nr:hypothetical protein T05_13217 [Trichinella murrelli]